MPVVTVIILSIVVQEQLTVVTVPYSDMAFMSVLATVVAPVLFLCTSYWEVGTAESLGWLQVERWSTGTLSLAIVSNQGYAKLFTEGPNIWDTEISELLAKNEAVCNANIEQKPKNVFVTLSALESDMVVSSQLVVVVHWSHVLVVEHNTLPITLLPDEVLF